MNTMMRLLVLVISLVLGCATFPLPEEKNFGPREVAPGTYSGWRARNLILSANAMKEEANCVVIVEEEVLTYTRLSTDYLPPLSYTTTYERIGGGCIRWRSTETKDITVMCPPNNINPGRFRAWSEKDWEKYYFFDLTEGR